MPAFAQWQERATAAGFSSDDVPKLRHQALAWSVIRPGDVILATRTRLPWIVASVSGAEVTVVRGAATHRATPDPDGPVDVLCPVVERAALVALREGLGAQITGRGP